MGGTALMAASKYVYVCVCWERGVCVCVCGCDCVGEDGNVWVTALIAASKYVHVCVLGGKEGRWECMCGWV